MGKQKGYPLSNGHKAKLRKQIISGARNYNRNCLSRPMNKNPVFSRVLEVVGSGKKR